MQQVTLSGQLVASPASVSDSGFPSGVTSVAFNLFPAKKPINVDTGVMRPIVNSPASFVTLPGVGAGGPVTQGTTLYLRSSTPMQIRTTTAVPSAADVVAIETISGLKIVEYDAAHYLKLLEIQGSGPIEYYVSGTL